jgi:hypothetical protein
MCAEAIELQLEQPLVMVEGFGDAEEGHGGERHVSASHNHQIQAVSCGDRRVRTDLQRVIEVVNMNDWLVVEAALISTFTATSLPGAT